MATAFHPLSAACAAAALLALAPAPARAVYIEPATIPCEAAIAGSASPALACERSPTEGEDRLDSPVPTVDEQAFFGRHGWVPLAREEGSALTDPRRGSFDVSALSAPYARILLVLAGGPGTTIVGYLLGGAVGSWESPFLASVFPGAGQGVLRATFYGAGSLDGAEPTETGIPAPAGLATLAVGLLGLAGAAAATGWRRRSPEA